MYILNNTLNLIAPENDELARRELEEIERIESQVERELLYSQGIN